jgi:hypothetical protein
MFDFFCSINVLFDSDYVGQLKNRLFLGSFLIFLGSLLVHKKSKFQLVKHSLKNNYVRLMFCSTFFIHDTGTGGRLTENQLIKIVIFQLIESFIIS